jgi:hypothetical protein
MASDYLVSTTCPICNEYDEVVVPLDGYLAWNKGALIQDAMPTVSVDVREQLMTGICPSCWEINFGEE